jgi:hypothetical protein
LIAPFKAPGDRLGIRRHDLPAQLVSSANRSCPPHRHQFGRTQEKFAMHHWPG